MAKVSIGNLKQVRNELENYGVKVQKDVSDKVDAALHEGAERIRTDAVKNAPEHDGLLKQNIKVLPPEGNGLSRVYYIIADVPYASAMEFGTKPFFPRITNKFKKWARDKLGDERLAFAVAKTIAQKGIQPQPFMMPAFYKNEERIKKNISEAMKGVGRK